MGEVATVCDVLVIGAGPGGGFSGGIGWPQPGLLQVGGIGICFFTGTG